MTATLMRSYGTAADFTEALMRLRAIGQLDGQVSALAHEQHPDIDVLTANPADPMIADGAAGVLSGGDPTQGSGLAVTPAYGSVLALGWLADSAAAADVAASGGSMAEALQAAGLPADQANATAEEVRSMRIVLHVRVTGGGDRRRIEEELDRPAAEKPVQRVVVTPSDQAETAA